MFTQRFELINVFILIVLVPADEIPLYNSIPEPYIEIL